MTTDTIIMYTLIVIFIGLGVMSPFLAGYGADSVNVNSNDPLSDDFIALDETVSGTDIFLGIAKMFTWTFGDLPVLIDIFVLLPLRFLLGYLIYRGVRGI